MSTFSVVRLRPVFLAALLLAVVLSGCLEPERGRPPEVGPPPRGPHAVHDVPPVIDWTYVPRTDRFDGSPYGVHLSWIEDPRTTMSVTWFTFGSANVAPVVRWGDRPDELNRSVSASSDPVYGSNVLAHRATLRDLQPGAWFYYQVSGRTGDSEIYGTRPARSDGEPFRFGFFADQGVENESLNVTGLMLQKRPDFLVLAGDIAYADGDQEVWDLYFHMHEPLFARVPLMTAPGNHEFKDGIFYDAYRTRFTLPNDGLWYGFDYGNTRFTIVEFYHASAGMGHLGGQRNWFREELRDTEARKVAGEIDFHAVVQHYPFYTNHIRRGHYYFNINLAEDLVLRHGVDLMLVGHEHYYERSHPMAYGFPTVTGAYDYEGPSGYIQVTSGGAGRPFSGMAPPGQVESWQAIGAIRWHFVEFYVDGDRLQAWAWAADGTGDLLDYFSLQPRPRLAI